MSTWRAAGETPEPCLSRGFSPVVSCPGPGPATCLPSQSPWPGLAQVSGVATRGRCQPLREAPGAERVGASLPHGALGGHPCGPERWREARSGQGHRTSSFRPSGRPLCAHSPLASGAQMKDHGPCPEEDRSAEMLSGTASPSRTLRPGPAGTVRVLSTLGSLPRDSEFGHRPARPPPGWGARPCSETWRRPWPQVSWGDTSWAPHQHLNLEVCGPRAPSDDIPSPESLWSRVAVRAHPCTWGHLWPSGPL